MRQRMEHMEPLPHRRKHYAVVAGPLSRGKTLILYFVDSMLPTGCHSCRSGRTAHENAVFYSAWHTYSLRWSSRTFSLGVLAISGMPSHLPPGKHDQSKAPSLQRVILHAFSGTTDLSDSLPAPHAFGLRPYTLGLCLTRLPGRVSPVPHYSFPTCRRLRPRGDPAFVPVQNAVCCLRRDMRSSALPNPFRLIICRGYRVH